MSLSLSPWNSDVNMNATLSMVKADDIGDTLCTHAKLLSSLLPKGGIMVILIYGPWALLVSRIA